jgi:hypothetical protein
MSPRLEGFKNGKQFLVVGVIVELGTRQGTTVEGDWMNFAVVGAQGEDTGDGVVGRVGFDDRR